MRQISRPCRTMFLVLAGVLGVLGPRESVAQSSAPIAMFGASYQADVFVWCIDRSGSMAFNGLMGVTQTEVAGAINQLMPAQFFSLLAFSDSFSLFSSSLLQAIPGNQAAAASWVNGIVPSGTTCVAPALLQSIGIAHQGSGDKAILYIGEGVPSCSSVAATLADVAAANTSQIPIHTICLVSDMDVIQFMQQLSAANNGTFLLAPGGVASSQFRRGDGNGDGAVNLTDVVHLLAYLFLGAPAPDCPDAADGNSDLALAIDDALFLLAYLFNSGSPPGNPGPLVCGSVVGGIGNCIGQLCP